MSGVDDRGLSKSRKGQDEFFGLRRDGPVLADSRGSILKWT
jgi:hypothetical protein